MRTDQGFGVSISLALAVQNSINQLPYRVAEEVAVFQRKSSCPPVNISAIRAGKRRELKWLQLNLCEHVLYVHIHQYRRTDGTQSVTIRAWSQYEMGTVDTNQTATTWCSTTRQLFVSHYIHGLGQCFSNFYRFVSTTSNPFIYNYQKQHKSHRRSDPLIQSRIPTKTARASTSRLKTPGQGQSIFRALSLTDSSRVG